MRCTHLHELPKRKIIIGKYDNFINISDNLKKKPQRLRIGSYNPNKLKMVVFTPIAAKEKTIYYNGDRKSVV